MTTRTDAGRIGAGQKWIQSLGTVEPVRLTCMASTDADRTQPELVWGYGLVPHERAGWRCGADVGP
jgi:hypothetical protein